MLSRRELNLLRALSQHGTVTAAAAAVHISQPAASALLGTLETRLGLALFTRERRRLQLTSQGRLLLPEVLNAASALDAVDRLADDIRRGSTTRLNVGAVAVASALLLPQALQRVRQGFAQAALTVRAGTAAEIMDMAADRRIDLGVVISGAARRDPRLASQRLARLALHAVLHPAHPLASRRRLRLADVAGRAGQALVVLAPTLPAGRATQQALQAAGLGHHPVLEVSQSFTACEFAGQQLGVAVVETLGAHYARQRGLVTHRLMMLDEPELALVHLRDKPLEGAALCLQQALHEAAAGWADRP